MSCFDKLYCKSRKDYETFLKWIKGRTYVSCYGNPIRMDEYLMPCQDDDWDNESRAIYQLTYTNDYFLIRDCHIPFVEEQMKLYYGREGFDEIRDGKSEYDHVIYPKTGNHFTILWHRKYTYNGYNFARRCNVTAIYDRMPLGYSEVAKRFLLPFELETTDSMRMKCKSIRAAMRRLRNMSLPIGTEVHIDCETIEMVLRIK